MARKPRTTATKKTKAPIKRTKKISMEKRIPDILPEAPLAESYTPISQHTIKNKIGYVVIGILAIAALLFVSKKDLFLAATVNGKPIYRWTLTKILVDRYGQQTLDSMITEMLITESAQRDGIVISQADIAAEEDKIVKSFGGKVSIDELLKYQGMTKTDFDGQIKLQLLVQKSLSKNITVTDEDVAAYIEKNQETMMATDEAGLTKEAKDALTNQQLSEKVQPWLTQLRSKAAVTTYLGK